MGWVGSGMFEATATLRHRNHFGWVVDVLVRSNPEKFGDENMPEIQLRPIEQGPANVPALAVAREMIRWLTQSGQLEVGDKLPSERELTDAFRVGRSAVREALKTLSLLGLVEIRPGSGTYLRTRPSELSTNLLEIDTLAGETQGPVDENHGKAIIEARVEVEVLLAGLAAARHSETDMHEIRLALEDLSRAGAARDLDGIVRADVAFHLAVAQAARSSVLAEFLGRVRNVMLVWMRRAMELNRDYDDTVEAHRLVAEEIANSNVEGASQAMRDHMRTAFAVFEAGSAHRKRLDIAAIGQEEAQRLVEATGETSQVGVLEGVEAVYVARADGTHALRLISEVGRRLPASCTAIGKALLSGLSDAELDSRYSSEPLPALTNMSITDIGDLKAALADVRVTGVALDNCESNEGVRCVAAPVRDVNDEIVAAVSISVPTVRWTPGQEARLTAMVIEAGRRMSRALAAPSSERSLGIPGLGPVQDPQQGRQNPAASLTNRDEGASLS